MYHGMGIMMESDLVFDGESANAHELIWELLYQVISGPDGLGCFRGCSRLGCGCCSGNRCRMCAGHLTMMAQFIFTTASFSLEGRPGMAGPGVSTMYQYKFTLWGQAPGQTGCQVMGPWSVPYRGIQDPL